jgi:fermentation-respiration switch protein FrsA (DUF1100 family)
VQRTERSETRNACFVKCPIKIFHGCNDNIIDIQHSKDLFEQIPNKKYKPTFIQNADHNDIINKIDLNEIKKIIT